MDDVVAALYALAFLGGVVITAALAEAHKVNQRLRHKTEAKILPFRGR